MENTNTQDTISEMGSEVSGNTVIKDRCSSFSNDKKKKINLKKLNCFITKTDIISERIFKGILLYLYFQEFRYIELVYDSIIELIDIKNCNKYDTDESDYSKIIPVEINSRIKLWIDFPTKTDADIIKCHIRGEILFSELNHSLIYGIIYNNSKSLFLNENELPLKLYPTQDWLLLSESVMEHNTLVDEDKKERCGLQAWKKRFCEENCKSFYCSCDNNRLEKELNFINENNENKKIYDNDDSKINPENAKKARMLMDNDTEQLRNEIIKERSLSQDKKKQDYTQQNKTTFNTTTTVNGVPVDSSNFEEFNKYLTQLIHSALPNIPEVQNNEYGIKESYLMMQNSHPISELSTWQNTSEFNNYDLPDSTSPDSDEDENTDLTKQKLMTMKLPELKTELKKIKLNINGKKQELQNRLIAHYKL
jgi:hypothetical protein